MISELGGKYYKTPTDTYIFINGTWLDDIYRVEWDLSRMRRPVYGYRDVHFGQIAEGHQLVRGSLIVHFTEPGYFAEALQGIVRNPPKDDRDPYRRITKLRNQIDSDITDIYQRTQSGTQERREEIARLLKWSQEMGMDEYLLHTLRSAFARRNDFAKPNLVEEPIYFSRRFFDIEIFYGHPDDPDAIIRRLVKCSLAGTSQTISAAAQGGGDMSSSAQSILEVYPFIAQRIEVARPSKIKLKDGTIS